MMARKRLTRVGGISLAVTLLVLSGCGGGAVFLDRSFDFSYIERVAIIPFDNLAQSQGAGKQATLIFITELLATESFFIIEPGEVSRVLGEVVKDRSGTLSLDQIKQMGERLNAQALIFGTVSESSTLRSGTASVPTVTMDLRMVETETGGTVWAASHTEGRPGLLTSLFGVSGKSSSETMRACVRDVIATLVD